MRLLLLSLVLLSSCKAGYYVRKADRAIHKAESLGAAWKTDTVLRPISLPLPVVRSGVSFTFPKQAATVLTVARDCTRLKLVRIPVPVDSAAIIDRFRAEIEVPARDTVIYVPVEIRRELDVPDPPFPWKWLFVAVVAAAIAITTRRILK